MKKISLMYSGGLDSTLTALTLGKTYDKVHLLTYKRGYGHWFVKWSSTRVDELDQYLGKPTYTQVMMSSKELFKKMVIECNLTVFYVRYNKSYCVITACHASCIMVIIWKAEF